MAAASPFAEILRCVASAADLVELEEAVLSDPRTVVTVVSAAHRGGFVAVGGGRRRLLPALGLMSSWHGAHHALAMALAPFSWHTLSFAPAIVEQPIPDFAGLARTLWRSLVRRGGLAAATGWLATDRLPSLTTTVADGQLAFDLAFAYNDLLPPLLPPDWRAFEVDGQGVAAAFSTGPAAAWLDLATATNGLLSLPSLAVSAHETLDAQIDARA